MLNFDSNVSLFLFKSMKYLFLVQKEQNACQFGDIKINALLSNG